ncbi:MAG: polyphosphate kinase 2 [Saprospiraceae bacterium]|nr:polyphosphate kinase 2 [Saprospiraceae bacterium]
MYYIPEEYRQSKKYWEELFHLQVELLKLQRWIYQTDRRLLLIFEGRDAAGKGGAILRFTQNLNPKHYRVMALKKPSELEMGQWFFQRYFLHIPNAGEMVFFDRSWYNRAVVEPAMGFCSQEEYELFIEQVKQVEKMLTDDGIFIIKFWFSIDKQVQQSRLDDRLSNPLKRWKVSPVDMLAQEKWDEFTHYKSQMYRRTHSSWCPWIIVRGNDKEGARMNAIRYVLSRFDYQDKAPDFEPHDPNIVFPYQGDTD